ncbi:MAG: hypothetical protein HY897_04200 [Deltaproteobacteria bacterium]|nr:hypothetical protein [Deltaproteobacteria bacterium]
MHTLLLAILIATTAAVLLLAGARLWARGAEQPSDQSANPPAVTQPAPAKTAEPAKPLTREEIARKLKELADKPLPADLEKFSPMCYEQTALGDTIDYLCPKDGSRTQYSKTQEVGYGAAIGIGHKLKNIKGIELSVDGSEFCRKCSPDQKNPKPVLIVKLSGNTKDHRFRGVTYDLADTRVC